MERNSDENSAPVVPAAQKPAKSLISPFMLQSWKPTFTWKSSVTLYLALGATAFLYGLIITAFNATVMELVFDYGDVCKPDTVCQFSFNVPMKMEQPVFLYYGLRDFYQNHRLYVVSKSSPQLAGNVINRVDADKGCTSAVTNAQLDVTKSWGNTPLDPNAIASPCGLIAKAYFNDTYELWANQSRITLNEKGIAFPYAAGKIFKRAPDSEKTQWIDPENEHFMVWMRTSVFSDGRKLWAKVQQDLPAGTYTMKIYNNYHASAFASQKYFVLTTSNALGGKVEFLASAFIVIGMVFLLISLFFFYRSRAAKRVPLNVRGVSR